MSLLQLKVQVFGGFSIYFWYSRLLPTTVNAEISKFCVICGKYAGLNHLCQSKDLCFEHTRA